MLQDQGWGQEDGLHGHTNVSAQGNNEYGELLEREQIKDTPFVMVGNKTDGYFIGFGLYKLTEMEKTKEEALAVLESKRWLIAANMMISIVELNKKWEESDKRLAETDKE